jgi:Domain of unknown function (DUF5134)
MTHQHAELVHTVGLAGPVAVVAAVASAAVALVHLGRLARVAVGRQRRFVPAEVGHVTVAAGMAVMVAGPRWVVSSAPFAAAYLGLAVVLLALVLTRPACCVPSLWSCCSMLVIEALAMAYMSGAGGSPVGDLTGWFVVVFAGAALAAVGGPLVRRMAPAWAGAPPITPAGSRLVMSAGMLLMLVR